MFLLPTRRAALATADQPKNSRRRRDWRRFVASGAIASTMLGAMLGSSILGFAVAPAFARTVNDGLSPDFASYQVQSGDTIDTIAGQYGLTAEQIAKANGFAPGAALTPGQQVNIPLDDLSAIVPNQTVATPPTILAPFISQLDGSDYAGSDCGPTSLAMALGAFGKSFGVLDIRHSADVYMGTNDPGNGTSWEALAYAAGVRGFQVDGLFQGKRYRKWTRDDLTAEFAQGRPVLLLVRYWNLPGHESSTYSGDHYVLALGFDAGGNLIYNDPAYSGQDGLNLKMTPQQLDKAWGDTWAGLTDTAMAVVGS